MIEFIIGFLLGGLLVFGAIKLYAKLAYKEYMKQISDSVHDMEIR